MSGALLAVLVVLAVVAAIALLWALRRASRLRNAPPGAVITDSRSLTSLDDETGAVRSVQSADVFLPAQALDEIWSPENLERLAATYWRFLTRITLGLIRVAYTDEGRAIVLLASPLKLLTFQAPEYEMHHDYGLVRWRIARGLLVARRGRDGGGYLQIEVRRGERDGEQARLHVSVEVANFYPSIASRVGRRFYDATQSRIHVIVTNRFLRSLLRLDLAESRVGRYRS
ncbi:MAG TPA: hypothetical protein VL988_07025 [Solirubrobacteraceae bacterium]|nr:hypothetical protein [Solirubrobacteraceae bacterium]